MTILLAFVVASLLTPLCGVISRKLELLDHPNDRSSHSVPTPRTGGNAIVLAIGVTLLFTGAWREASLRATCVAAAVLAIVGICDDLKPLPEWFKFLVQTGVAAGLLIWSALALTHIDLPFAGKWTIGFAGLALSWFWIVGWSNAFNFMDGINGIAGAQAIVAGATYALFFHALGDASWMVVALAVASAAAGFLLWNVSGWIFMGDVGSVTLGLLLAAMVLRLAADGVPVIAAVLPLVPFLFDTAVTLVRRIVRGERFFSAHRSHFYQRLVSLGWSHPAVSALWTTLEVIGAIAALHYSKWSDGVRLVMLTAFVALHIIVAMCISSALRRRSV